MLLACHLTYIHIVWVLAFLKNIWFSGKNTNLNRVVLLRFLLRYCPYGFCYDVTDTKILSTVGKNVFHILPNLSALYVYVIFLKCPQLTVRKILT